MQADQLKNESLKNEISLLQNDNKQLKDFNKCYNLEIYIFQLKSSPYYF